MKKVKGEYLSFITQIMPDGIGTDRVKENPVHDQNTIFKLSPLSLSEGTYIAHGVNSFVVKLKDLPKWEVESEHGDFFVSLKDRTIGEINEGLTASEADKIKDALNEHFN